MVGVLVSPAKIVATNESENLVFFEDSDLCYNYKTGQWSALPALNGISYVSIKGKGLGVGLVRFSSGSVDLQHSGSSAEEQTATITTAAKDLNQGGRVVVNGARPLINGGTVTVRIGVQDTVGGAVTWSASTSLNSRTNMANFRSEGRYVRAEFTITGGFTTAWGADVDFSAQGQV